MCSFFVDVVVTHASSRSYVRHGDSAGALLARAEKDKLDKHHELAERTKATLVPFAVTSAGGLGERALEFVKKLVSAQVHRGDSERAYNAAVHRALRRISVALHSGNAAVLRTGIMDAQVGQGAEQAEVDVGEEPAEFT